jgi:protein-S-isoprenylcysteine O-methyltransferase Ste14
VTLLERQAYAGLIKFLIGLALLLFVPAWSLRYGEAWAYWGLFAIWSTAVTIHFLKHDPRLIERRLQVGPGAERDRRQKIVQAITAFLLIALFVVSGIEHRLNAPNVPAAIVLSADAVVVIAFGLILRVFKENSYAAGVVQVEDSQPVVTSGPYRFIRHPMYAGAVLLFVATPLALGSLWGEAVGILLSVMIVVRLVFEERYLSAHLPGYEAYCQKVRSRLVPFVW